MAKVNKRPFHCIPLAVFTDNGHSTLSSKVSKKTGDLVESALLVWGTWQEPDSRVKKQRWLIHQRSVTVYILLMLPLPHVLFPSKHIFPSPLCFPSDVPGGFSVIQGEEPTEGGRLSLTCVANKYLYTMLSWQRVNDGEDAHSHDAALGSHQLTSGEFSNFLVLSVNNLTARHSGVYRCSAHHRITGQETHLDTRAAVISKWCSHSFSLFSNFLFDVRKRYQSSSFLLSVDLELELESTWQYKGASQKSC